MPVHKRPLPTPPSAGDNAGQPPVSSSTKASRVASPRQREQESHREEMEEVGDVGGEEVEVEEEEDEAEDTKPPRPWGMEQQQEKPLQPEMARPLEQHQQPKEDSDEGERGGGGGGRSEEEEDEDDNDNDEEASEKEEFIQVKLADIRKEVQCPICLGIIRKTRTVMECLHRFCRECIDKSMRLGNNECPACRTHCASRRSLRDDPNYDALIAILYPDIDKYEEEELAFREEEKSRNKKIQAAIAETFRRQTEALGRRKYTAKTTAAAFVRKSQGNYRSHGQISYLRGRGRSGSRESTHAASDDDDHGDDELEANGNDGSKESSSADEPSPDTRQKRCKRLGAPRPPAQAAGSADVGCEETDDFDVSRESIRKSPLRAGKREMLAWGKNGARSQTRHGNYSGSNGRMVKGGRMAKLVDYLHNVDEKEDEFDVHLTLVSLDEGRIPNLKQPYVCCRPTLSIRHLCEFIAFQTRVQAEEVQFYVRKPQGGVLATKSLASNENSHSDPLVGLQILKEQESLAALSASFIDDRGELVLVYCLKVQS